MIEKNKIYNKDCVEGMKDIDDESIPLIVADPPYEISRDSQFATLKDRKKPRTGTYFGKWDEKFDNAQWIAQAARVLTSGGSLLVFNDIKKITTIIELAEKNGLVYKDTIIWNKSNPMPRNVNRRYAPDIEAILWFWKPKKKWTFNKQGSHYESSVIRLPSESGGGFKRYHPTQKPVKLISELIKVHSNPGDIVLDPFMGGGSTAVAAVLSKRDFVGFEIDPNYCDIATKRADEAKK
jgi:site-specific DNA-methyltransferase (adenine-specific)